MKTKIFALIVISLLLVVMNVFAAAPALSVVDANYVSGGDTTFWNLVNDTCGAGDSATLFSAKGMKLEQGWQYILANDPIVASGDSVGLRIVIDCMADSTTYVNRVVIDSITTEATKYTLLPFLGTVFGQKFRLKLMGISTLNGTTVVLGKFHLYRRRVEGTSISSWN